MLQIIAHKVIDLLYKDIKSYKMHLWETIIRAVDPKTGHLVTWQGPHVRAFTPGLAQNWCQLNGYGFCKVTGERVIMEVPERNGKADWKGAISFEDRSELN